MHAPIRDAPDLVLRGRLAAAMGSAPERAEAGRTCDCRGCATRLSVYNTGTRCWQHTAPRAPRAPRGRWTGRLTATYP